MRGYYTLEVWGAAGCGQGGTHITAVGDQLAEEDLLLGVERVNDDVHELVHVGLELELLAILLGGSRRRGIVGLDADVDASPRAGGLRGRGERRRLLLEGGGLRAERGEDEEELHIGNKVSLCAVDSMRWQPAVGVCVTRNACVAGVGIQPVALFSGRVVRTRDSHAGTLHVHSVSSAD